MGLKIFRAGKRTGSWESLLFWAFGHGRQLKESLSITSLKESRYALLAHLGCFCPSVKSLIRKQMLLQGRYWKVSVAQSHQTTHYTPLTSVIFSSLQLPTSYASCWPSSYLLWTFLYNLTDNTMSTPSFLLIWLANSFLRPSPWSALVSLLLWPLFYR